MDQATLGEAVSDSEDGSGDNHESDYAEPQNEPQNEDQSADEPRTVEWDWTVDSVAEYAGYGSDGIAAYQCCECSTINPIQFLSDNPETPEHIERVCSDIWGGCVAKTKMELISDGVLDLQAAQGDCPEA